MKKFFAVAAAVVALSTSAIAAPVIDKEQGDTVRVEGTDTGSAGGQAGQNGAHGDKR